MDIEVKFDGKEIIVTKPGTDFMLAYLKRPDSPTLKLTRSKWPARKDQPTARDQSCHAGEDGTAWPQAFPYQPT